MYGINSYLEKLPLLSEYYLHNHKLTIVTNTKYLGVTLDSTLSRARIEGIRGYTKYTLLRFFENSIPSY